MFAGLCGKCFTAESFWPMKAKTFQHWFAACSGLFTERSAGRLRCPRHTLRSINGAQERLHMRGACHLYEWCKCIYFQRCVVLVIVAQNVGQHCLSVMQVFAERHRDRLTTCYRCHCSRNVFTLDFEKYKTRKSIRIFFTYWRFYKPKVTLLLYADF